MRLADDMKRVVTEQRLAYVATVCADGTPNLSPKGTIAVWDDEQLVFANVRSPGTLANLRRSPSVELNVVDPFARRGYRFKGVATVLEAGPLYQQAIDSPAYDLGLGEEAIRSQWERYYRSLRAGKADAPTRE